MKLFLLQKYQIACHYYKEKQRVTSCNVRNDLSKRASVAKVVKACVSVLSLSWINLKSHTYTGAICTRCVYKWESDSKMLFGAVMRAQKMPSVLKYF